MIASNIVDIYYYTQPTILQNTLTFQFLVGTYDAEDQVTHFPQTQESKGYVDGS